MALKKLLPRKITKNRPAAVIRYLRLPSVIRVSYTDLLNARLKLDIYTF